MARQSNERRSGKHLGNTECTKCKLHNNAKNVCLRSYGHVGGLLLLGEAPGEKEDKQNMPFVGKTGTFLRNRLLPPAGIDKEEVRYGNAVRCLHGKTMVLMPDGSQRFIRELVRDNYRGYVKSYDIKNDCFVLSKVINTHKNDLGNRYWIKVSTVESKHKGPKNSIVGDMVTNDHLYLTEKNVWVRADKLNSCKLNIGAENLSSRIFDIAVGTILGDAHIPYKGSHLQFFHSTKQQEWFEIKANAFKDLGSKSSFIMGKGNDSDGFLFNSKTCKQIKWLRDEFYKDRIKRIPVWVVDVMSPQILATWFMDDGYTQSRKDCRDRSDISVCSFSYKDCEILLKAIIKLGIVGKIHESIKRRRRILFDVENTAILCKVISKYVPPTMRYKLGRTTSFLDVYDSSFWSPLPMVARYAEAITRRVEKICGKRSKVAFCLDVDNTHNFITPTGIAHNCHPKDNKTPTIGHILNCREYLEQEVRYSKPKVICLLGNVPLASALDFAWKPRAKSESKVSGISKWRGKKIWHREFNCWVVPTFHPSYVQRQFGAGSDTAYEQVIYDLEMANALVYESRLKFTMPESILITNVQLAKAAIMEMWEAGVYAFDIETGGTKMSERYIIGCSLACSEKRGYYFPWDWLVDRPNLYKLLFKLLNSKKHYKIMHNGAYEKRIFKINRLPLYDKYFDTMIAAQLVDENFYKGLKDLSWLHTTFGGYDVPLEKYKKENKIKEDYSPIPLDILGKYGGLDSVATFILYKRFKKKLRTLELLPTFTKISMPVRRVMSDSEYHGFRVDSERALKLSAMCSEAMLRLETKVYEEAGAEFNINSRQQLQNILFKKMGLTPIRKTKTGFSTDVNTIEQLATQEGGEIADYLIDRSYIKTLMGTHIQQAITHQWADHRVHTNFNMTGAVTNRTTCSNPSLHNVPRDRLVRSLYIASEGCMLIDADLKQAELAYLAAESGEEVFLRAFAEGLDLHMETAKLIYGISDPTEEQRQTAKSINFAVIYGMTVIGLAKKLKMTIEDADDFIENYFDRLPKVAEYMERNREQAKELGYVSCLFNVRRRLPEAMSDDEYVVERALRQAMNGPIQTGAAFYTYVGLIRLYRAIKKRKLQAKLVHTVHDCAITDTPIPEIDRVTELNRIAFETPIKLIPVKMHIDIEVSKRWGEHGESKLEGVLNKVGLFVN